MEDLIFSPWGRFGGIVVAIVVATQIAYRVVWPLLRRIASHSKLASAIVARAAAPLQLLAPAALAQVALQGMPDGLGGLAMVEHLNGMLVIAGFTWLAIAAVQGVSEGIMTLHPADVVDNLEARRIQTQTRVLSRTANSVILIAGLAFILMTFPRARQLGSSILASAGIAGLVVGIAARSVFSNLLAGLQIALAQPLRIDDVLIVDGEWGRVEEITSTYVVLKIWDERRLIVPLGWFIEHPFQNWTRRSADILGTVMLWLDFTLPVEALRKEALRICKASKHWDHRVAVVQVVETSERAMQVRILVSSAESGANFDLRCELREGLIDFVRREYPAALPRLRVDERVGDAVVGGPAGDPRGDAPDKPLPAPPPPGEVVSPSP